jgi:hypothetical protein
MDWWSIFLYLITVSRKNSWIFFLGLKIIKTNIIYYEQKINQTITPLVESQLSLQEQHMALHEMFALTTFLKMKPTILLQKTSTGISCFVPVLENLEE